MKLILFMAALLTSYGVQATSTTTVIKNKNCASNVSDLANIDDIMNQINPWGLWEGSSATGKKISVTLSKDPQGRFQGQANFDGKNVGPLGMTVCDYSGDYSFSLSFFTIDFLIHSSKQIEILYAFDGADTVILNKRPTKKVGKKY
jgi:hypothetical protein